MSSSLPFANSPSFFAGLTGFAQKLSEFAETVLSTQYSARFLKACWTSQLQSWGWFWFLFSCSLRVRQFVHHPVENTTFTSEAFCGCVIWLVVSYTCRWSFWNLEKGALEKAYLHISVRKLLSNLRQVCTTFLWRKQQNTCNLVHNSSLESPKLL